MCEDSQLQSSVIASNFKCSSPRMDGQQHNSLLQDARRLVLQLFAPCSHQVLFATCACRVTPAHDAELLKWMAGLPLLICCSNKVHCQATAIRVNWWYLTR